MLLMIEKGIIGGTCHAIHQYVKANNKYMKDYDKNKEHLYLNYWGINNLYGWGMSKTFPVSGFKFVEIHFNLVRTLYKTIVKIVIKVINVQYLKNRMTFTMIYNDCLKE